MTIETVLSEQQKSDLAWNYEIGFTVIKAIEQAVLKSPEIQALRKDAERYKNLVSKWLDSDCEGEFILMNNRPPCAYRSKSDIDATMEQQP